jgi:diguanylate cyclase (GGDEF)-like protein
MTWGLFRLLALCLAAAVAAAAARAAVAQDVPPTRVCHASAAITETYADLARQPSRWTCAPRDWSIASERAFMRFDLSGEEDAPAALVTRLTRFGAAELTVIGIDGGTASRTLTEAGMAPATSDWLMSAALPRLTGQVATVVLRVDGARHVGMLSDARLVARPGDTPASLRHEALIAMLCGMLCMPLLFNFAFFRVLRQRFLLWHALATTLMLAHTLITSGLINRFASASLGQLSIASSLTVGGGIIAASLFAAELIEPDKLDAVHRRMLRYVAIWVPPWTLFYLFADGAMRPYAAPLYLASFLVPMGLFAWAMWVALRRGSRAVNYQIAAWTPMMLTALVRIASANGLTDAPIEMLVAQHYAMGLEVIITSLGVFDRLLAIRRQRDLAVADLRVIEDRAERDPLTGLLNRRMIEKRFDQLHAGGFRAMAIIDLDKFKAVNDTYGHVVGDQVLRAAAEALSPDADTLAMRLGGEEFLLLLRGKDAAARAERRRQAISTRVASKVPGLDHVVTASMGFVEQPSDGAMVADFAALYAHCDRLLYEAKHAGRNRTMREKMLSFGHARGTRAA